MAVTTREKGRENRLRRMADRQGLMLRKSRRRDTRAIDYGSWQIVDIRTSVLVAGGQFGMSLEEVEEWLIS